MNVLLHICCAPCSIFPVEVLRKEDHKFAGFFYNPNIHPYSEYIKRREEVEKYAIKTSFSVICSDYDVESYFQKVAYDEDVKDRCPGCWWMRLDKAAEFAKENGFDAFTTTLLGSPYQDHEVIKEICKDVAKKYGLSFYYSDFRVGFKKAHDMARSEKMYCQNYCGCLFSEKERIEAKDRKR